MASAAEQLAANLNFGAFQKATELQKRIWFTVIALIVYRLGTYIPMPGIDAAQFAQAFEGQRLEQLIGTERAVVANTRSAFATYQAAQRAIASNTVAVQANELALEGARAERSVGTRTVLDVLNNQQNLVNAQRAYAEARYNFLQARLNLEQAAGTLDAADVQDVNRLLTANAPTP